MLQHIIAALYCLFSSSLALAKPAEPPLRQARFADDGKSWTMSVEYPDLFDAALAKRLDSGFAMNLVARAWLFRDGEKRPEAIAVRTLRAAYDLWDEVYLIEERDAAGTRSYREKTRADAIRRIASLDRLPVVPSARVGAGASFHVAVLVEVNPVSPELAAQVRSWLTGGGQHFAGAGESFFGSFVSIFVNPRVGDAEKVYRFRTNSFARGKP